MCRTSRPPRVSTVDELQLGAEARGAGRVSGVYSRHLRPIPRTHLPGEALMGEKRPARREFLRSGAALAGGFTLGAAAPALGQQAPGAAADDQRRAGGRDCLRRAVEVRHLGPHPARRQTLARQLRPHVSCRDPAAGFGRGHHAVLAPLLSRRRVARSCRISIPGSTR